MRRRLKDLFTSLVTGTTIGLAIVALTVQPALALDATSPLSASNGLLSCPTCVTESSPTQYGIPVWGTTQELGVISPSAETTKFLRSKGANANPAFEALAIGDIPSGTANQWGALIGTPTGTGEFVRATNPSLAGITLTGAFSASGATAPFTFPAGAIASVADLASGIKKGTANVAKLVTTTSGSTTTNNCAKWDSDGNLIDSGGTCGGSSSPAPVLSVSTTTPVTVLSATPVYVSLAGEPSTTESNVRTPFKNATTLGNMQCIASGNTTNAITAVIGTAACTSTANVTSKAQVVMSATANTTGTSSGTTAISAGECAVIKLTAGTDAAATTIHCTFERTA